MHRAANLVGQAFQHHQRLFALPAFDVQSMPGQRQAEAPQRKDAHRQVRLLAVGGAGDLAKENYRCSIAFTGFSDLMRQHQRTDCRIDHLAALVADPAGAHAPFLADSNARAAFAQHRAQRLSGGIERLQDLPAFLPKDFGSRMPQQLCCCSVPSDHPQVVVYGKCRIG